MRVVVTETVDPDGALCRWMSPDLTALGHQVVILPIQEGVHRLGISGWQMLLRDLSRSWKPDLVVCMPPYDYLDRSTARAIRAGGARLLAFGMDDALFLERWREADTLDAVLADYDAIYDLYASTCDAFVVAAHAAGYERFKTTRWALSRPDTIHPAADPIPPRAVLAGRAYPTRIDLVRRLVDARVHLRVRGFGWDSAELPSSTDAAGYLSAADYDQLLRQGVVISPADWEGSDVPMVKARVLETAMAGACQVAAWAPELAQHFDDAEVPSYRDVDQLIHLLRRLLGDPSERARLASAAQQRALRDHTWATRFGELLDALDHHRRGCVSSPERALDCPSYGVLLQGLASTAEATGRPAAAAAFYSLAELAGVGPSATLGAARCHFTAGRSVSPAPLLGAMDPLEATVNAGQRSLYVRVQSPVIGVANGHNRFLNPMVEVVALSWMSLVRSEEVSRALADLENRRGDPDLIIQVAAIIAPEPGAEPFLAELFAAALAAEPKQTRRTQESHRAAWAEWLGAYRERS